MVHRIQLPEGEEAVLYTDYAALETRCQQAEDALRELGEAVAGLMKKARTVQDIVTLCATDNYKGLAYEMALAVIAAAEKAQP